MNSVANSSGSGANDSGDEVRGSDDETPEQVLVLPLSGNETEPIGLMSEQKVLEMEEKRQVDVIPIGVAGDQDLTDSAANRHRGESQEKRTR